MALLVFAWTLRSVLLYWHVYWPVVMAVKVVNPY